MKATELMIGDWVYNLYHKNNIQWNYREMFCPNGNPVIGKDLYPITLTPEILEKNGLHFNKIYSVYEIHQFGTHIELDWENGMVCGISINKTDKTAINTSEVNIIKDRGIYVHELQHALRLCGLDELADNLQI